MCFDTNNNFSCIWLIIILILLFSCCGNRGNSNCGCDNGSSCCSC